MNERSLSGLVSRQTLDERSHSGLVRRQTVGDRSVLIYEQANYGRESPPGSKLLVRIPSS